MAKKYWWIRIYDYSKADEDSFHSTPDQMKNDYDIRAFESYKGTLLDEYYLCGESMTRDDIKKEIKEKSGVSRFAKPRNTKQAVRYTYALIMESNEFYYNRFTVKIDDICFNCYRPIKGKLKDFPQMSIEDKMVHFCSYECCAAIREKLNPGIEGEWQSRTTECGVFGYIYHIYNRKTNKHYIGQSRYAPFFRWQEHYKSGLKGDIIDLEFDVITEVRKSSSKYLNSIEAWWIRKYIDNFGKENVMNITIPPITFDDLFEKYCEVIEGQKKCEV